MNSRIGTFVMVIAYIAVCYFIYIEIKKNNEKRLKLYSDHLDKLRTLECFKVADVITKKVNEKVSTNSKKRKVKK